MRIQKSNKKIVKYNRNKIIQTCMSAGSPLKLASKIATEVKQEGYDGMTTDEIRMRVYIKLKKINPDVAEQYVYRSNLKVRTSRTSLEYFQESKIVDSLVKETKVDRSFAQIIAKEVAKELGRMRLNYVTAPLIREIVNVKLLEKGMESVRARYTRLGMPIYDVRQLIEEGAGDMAQYSPEAVHKVMSDQIAREYALVNVLPVDLADAHISGQIHIHDLNYFPLKPTTFSHDLRFFLTKGLKVDGTGEYTAVSGPAKHPESAFMHALKVLIAGQTECSREQIIEDFNFILAPYVSGLDYGQVKQVVQMLFYEISQTSVGKGGQSIYACLSCDTGIPKYLKDVKTVMPGGKSQKDTTYSDYADEAQTILKAILEVSLEGDSLGKPFVYPKLEFNVTGRLSSDISLLLSKLVIKYGTPYFQKTGKHLIGPRRGIIQYVTINLPQLSYFPDSDPIPLLENRMKKALEVLLLKKKVIQRNLDSNLLPFLKQKAERVRYYGTQRQVYAISYNGLNELVMAQTGSDMSSRSGSHYAKKIIGYMMKKVEEFRSESELDIRLSPEPKGICYTRFACLDSTGFPSKAHFTNKAHPYYSKSHYSNSRRLSEKFKMEARLNKLVNGRSLASVRLFEGHIDPEMMSDQLRKILSYKGINNLTLVRDLTICSKCGTVYAGISGKCRECKSSNVSVWSRDTGHIQNTMIWNIQQRQSYLDDYRYRISGQGVYLKPDKKRIILKY